MATIALPVEAENDFLRFLESLTAASGVPITERLGMLAGNPGGTGQRLILLVFDEAFEPAFTVKTGLTSDAKQLVAKEQEVLEALPATALGKPELRGVFASNSVQALALPFYPGRSPKGEHEPAIFAILSSWLSATRSSPIINTEPWQRLRKASGGDKLVKTLEAKLSEQEIRLAIYHGDFAPWNIRTSHGKWTVLDWERSDINGIPGWDWFHYEIQTAILARKDSLSKVIEKVEGLLGTRLWRDYARTSEIAGFERELILAYLLNCVHVIKPSEGIEQTKTLITALRERWSMA